MNKPSFKTQDERDEYDDAFVEGEADECDGSVRNQYTKGTPGWFGYNAGVACEQKAAQHRPNWKAQAAYDDAWPSLPMYES